MKWKRKDLGRRVPIQAGKALDPGGRLGGFGCCTILAAGAIAVYSRTLSVPLILDDPLSIADNASIRRLWPIWPVLSPPDEAGVGGRPMLNLTYALNYAVGGASVSGYHVVNLLIHVLAGVTLFALVRHTLLRPVLAQRFGSSANALALAVSAIWAWHPLQTESVTYISQRAESLMGLFYMLTLYCFIRGAEADGTGSRRIWFSLSVLACAAGIGTKEVMVTAPLLVFLYDRTFISGSFSGAWRRNWPPYLALARCKNRRRSGDALARGSFMGFGMAVLRIGAPVQIDGLLCTTHGRKTQQSLQFAVVAVDIVKEIGRAG